MGNNRITVHDMLANANYATGGKSLVGENYEISDITSLPADFASHFTKVQVSAEGTATGVDKDMHAAVRSSVQIILTTVGVGFTQCVFKVQKSNVGGSDDKVWSDVTSASVTLTGTGSGFIEMPNGGLHMGKFLRVVATSSGGTADFYAIGLSHTN